MSGTKFRDARLIDMITRRPLAALVIPLSALALAACDTAHAPAPDAAADDADAASTAAPTEGDAATETNSDTNATAADDQSTPDISPTPPPGYTDGSGVNEGYPDLTPAKLTSEAERGEEGARNVLLYFSRALELKEFNQAYAMMRGEAREGTTAAQLTKRFADFGEITVSAPSGQIEGAAGTSYYTAPATITGSNGQKLNGEIVLSRVNDVPGASADQLRWHVRMFNFPKGS
tara:strand:- start:120 stop:818 length:699 start_codon:yes stop_codon:yes gene_type:complete